VREQPATGSALAIERRTIDVIPDEERHGTPRNQFTLWFGANMQITAIVDGALAVVFGADAIWAIIGLLIGNVLGGIVMALHSAQGPRLGLPQMISSRAQFGVYGAVVPLLLVVLMYLGFAATGTVLAGQAVGQILHADSPGIGIVVFGVLTAVVAVTGYRLIHTIGRIASVVGIVGFTYLAVRLFAEYDVASVVGVKPFDFVTFLLAISLGAGWQLTFGPYVADYSRYLPRDTSDRHLLVDIRR
jgi:nucleobase:cation symporter-1, NCS1 family